MRVATTQVVGVATSNWLPLDQYADATNDGVFVTVGAGCTVSLQVTADNVFDSTVSPTAFALPAGFTNQSANFAAALPFAARAIRINQTVGSVTSTLQVVTKGLR